MRHEERLGRAIGGAEYRLQTALRCRMSLQARLHVEEALECLRRAFEAPDPRAEAVETPLGEAIESGGETGE